MHTQLSANLPKSDHEIAQRARYQRVVLVGVVVLAALGATACSRSLGEFATADAAGAPVVVSPLVTTGSIANDVPVTALAPEEAGLANYDPMLAQLPDDDGATADVKPKKLTPEEKARIIAELEALARRQSEY